MGERKRVKLHNEGNRDRGTKRDEEEDKTRQTRIDIWE